MQIRIKSQGQEDKIYNEVNTPPALLVAMLWSESEPNHKHVVHKDTADIKMNKEKAQEKLDAKVKKEKAGKISIEIKDLKHQHINRNLGITLAGEYDGSHVAWKEMTIDKDVFKKYRPKLADNYFLRLISVLQRESVKSQIVSEHNNPAPSEGNQGPDEFDPRTDLSKKLTLGIKDKQNQEETEPAKSHSFRQIVGFILKHPLVHGLAVAGILGLGLSFTGLSFGMIAGISAGVGALTFGIEFLVGLRQERYEKAYQEVKKMTPDELNNLDNSYRSNFKKGLEADTWGAWGKSIADTSAWKQYRAFGVGMKAHEHQDVDLPKKLGMKA